MAALHMSATLLRHHQHIAHPSASPIKINPRRQDGNHHTTGATGRNFTRPAQSSFGLFCREPHDGLRPPSGALVASAEQVGTASRLASDMPPGVLWGPPATTPPPSSPPSAAGDEYYDEYYDEYSGNEQSDGGYSYSDRGDGASSNDEYLSEPASAHQSPRGSLTGDGSEDVEPCSESDEYSDGGGDDVGLDRLEFTLSDIERDPSAFELTSDDDGVLLSSLQRGAPPRLPQDDDGVPLSSLQRCAPPRLTPRLLPGPQPESSSNGPPPPIE